MIAKFDVNKLKSTLGKVERVAATTASFPILQCVKIVAGMPNSATFIATDSMIGIRLQCECLAVEEAGEVLLNARKFASLVRQLSGGELVMTADTSRARLAWGGSVFTMVVEDGAEYPDLPDCDLGDMVLDGKGLRQLFSRTAWAVDDQSYSLFANCFFDLKELKAIATDKKVFACDRLDAEGTDGQAIMSRQLVNTFLATFDGSDDIAVGVRDNHIVFSAANVVLIGRLIEGQVPDFTELLQRLADNSITMKVNRTELLAVVRRALLFPQAINGVCMVSLTLGDKLTVQTCGNMLGDSLERISAEIDGKLEIFCNASYLATALNSCDADEILFKFSDPEQPFVFEECADTRTVYVIMPMRP